MDEKKVVGIECRFAVHVPTRSSELEDFHLIKELIHYSDGETKPNLRLVRNYKRPFWITKPSFQNHKDKKEWEDIDKLLESTCTQSELRYKAAKTLGKPWSKDSMKVLSQSPYLYGTDITSTALIKSEYMKKYPEVRTGYTTCVYDIETDVVNGTEEILMATVVFKNQIYTVVVKSFLEGYSSPGDLVYPAFDKYMAEYKERLNLNFEFVIADSPADVVKVIFAKVHQWMPDFLAIWNMDFDIPRTIKTLEDAGFNPADILSDPKVPPQYRKCYYKEGRKKKITSSGKVTPINPSSQWHTLQLTSSFYVIDAMGTYKQLRTPPNPEEPSYALDAILKKEGFAGKLRFKEADEYTGLKWHEVMQTKFKIEYIIYNIVDCVAIIEMNNKTKDLSHSLPSFAGYSDFEKYTSNPRKIHDALHEFCLERGKVIGSSGSVMFDDDLDLNVEEDEVLESADGVKAATEILSLKGWIVTLLAHLTDNLGLELIVEDSKLKTNIRGYVFDSDEVAAYPSATEGCNVSKETTKRELCGISDITEYTMRMQNINLLSGPVNAVEYCVTMFNFPTLDGILQIYQNEGRTD